MKIEEAIKQRKFEDKVEKLAINILFTANWLSDKMDTLLKRHNLTSQQFNVLRILKGQHPSPASVILIKERMLDRESNASRLVDKLLAAGLVTRHQCPKDRRQVDVALTEKGIALLDEINPLIKKEVRSRLKIDQAEAEKLSDLLDEIRNEPGPEDKK